jgi:hypothetical protein
MSIGHKGMMNAAQTIALTAQNLFKSPNLIEQAKENCTKEEEQKYLNINPWQAIESLH